MNVESAERTDYSVVSPRKRRKTEKEKSPVIKESKKLGKEKKNEGFGD